MKAFFRGNGLSIVMFGAFALILIGQIFAGHRAYNHDQQDHGQPTVGLTEYLTTGHFLEATAENWESEFLQMAAFVILTCCLFQKGSPESKDPDQEEPVDQDPRLSRSDPDAPWPVRRGGWVLRLYSHSLSLAFLLLFLISFALHAIGGASEYNEEQMQHGQPTVTVPQYVVTSRFWYESLQNWQSEFLAIGSMVLLSVYLRQRGSAESKPVATPHDEHGDEAPRITDPPLDRTNGRPHLPAATS